MVAVVAGGVLAYAADEPCPCELIDFEEVDVEDVGEEGGKIVWCTFGGGMFAVVVNCCRVGRDVWGLMCIVSVRFVFEVVASSFFAGASGNPSTAVVGVPCMMHVVDGFVGIAVLRGRLANYNEDLE